MSATQDLLRFGVFEVNVTTEELRKSGTVVRLAPQPLKLLALLARRSGQVVAREEIQKALWGGETYVDFEQGMNHCIKQIRTALNDSADTPLYIETVPRRGYRFLAPVVTKTIPAPAPRVIESQSGIQTSVAMPGRGSMGTTGPAKPVMIDPTAALKTQAPLPVAPIPEATAPNEVKPAPGNIPWKLITFAAVLLLLAIAAIVYWRTSRVSRLNRTDAMDVLVVRAAPPDDALPLEQFQSR